MTFTKVTKAEFLRRHTTGDLLLIHAGTKDKEYYAKAIATGIAKGHDPRKGYIRRTDGTGMQLDGKGTTIYECDGFMYVETLPINGQWEKRSSRKPSPLTVIYFIDRSTK